MSGNVMLKAMSSVGGWTLVSRVAGFAREIIFAALFGSSATAEAFQVAFALPNMFRRFFGEGAFNTAFIPLYSKKIEKNEDALAFANNVFSALAIFLIFFSALASLAMPLLVWLMASGFVGDARFDMAVDYGRVCFPYILFISLAAIVSGALNANGRFAAAAAAPVLLNIILITAMVFADDLGLAPEIALIWGVPIAGIAQLALVWFALRQSGVNLRLTVPKWTPDLKEMLIIAAPAALAGGVLQVNLLVGRQVASQFEGAIQWVAVADRLYQLPLGVVGIAIGVVLLPTLSKAIAAKDQEGGNRALNDAFTYAFLLTTPATVALVCIPVPIVEAMFERGAFTANDTAQTAKAVALFGAGLPAFVLSKIYQPLFFARGDTKTPFRIALVGMVINAALAFGLMATVGFIAAAIATSVSSYVMLGLLIWKARQFGDASHLTQRTIKSAIVVALASGLLALLFIPASGLIAYFDINKYSALGLYVILGLIVLAALCVLPQHRHLIRR